MCYITKITILAALILSLAAAQNRYAIMDNDYTSTSMIPFLMALDAGIEVLALTTCTGDTWEPQVALHALALLELGNLTSVPVIRGSVYPLLNTPELFQAWEMVHGALPWQGAFAPQNLTAEALGRDPTSGDPYRISKAAFVEGYPRTQATPGYAVNFMIEAVHKFPGQVSIFAAGPLTNIALAVRADPMFASLAKELVVMGGYIDTNLFMVTGDLNEADINSDINMMIDPEAAKIALGADFPEIVVAGNVANQVYPDDKWLQDLISVNNSYIDVWYRHAFMNSPFWDETAAGLMISPSLNLNSTTLYIDVDTSYASPGYGNVHAYQKSLMPMTRRRNVTYVHEVDGARLKEMITHAMQSPPSVHN